MEMTTYLSQKKFAKAPQNIVLFQNQIRPSNRDDETFPAWMLDHTAHVPSHYADILWQIKVTQDFIYSKKKLWRHTIFHMLAGKIDLDNSRE